MINANDLAEVGCKYLGTPYTEMDCQAFVERCLKDCGIRKDLAGSNAWFRFVMKNGWVGTPEQCKAKFGIIPFGAFLFILKQDGKEPEKYRADGIGNASHIGIYTGMTGYKMVTIAEAAGNTRAEGCDFGNGAINSSSTHGKVCTSKFSGKSISGGWNRVGLWDAINYGIKGGDKVNYQVKVIGGSLNMRKQPNLASDRLCSIPDGEILTITEETPEWAKTAFNGHVGWVMQKYLERVSGDSDSVTVNRKALQAVYDEIGRWLGYADTGRA